MAEESVKVAVRVRPFNQREKDRSAKMIIKMDGDTTTIEDPENAEAPKPFAFDHSYWSHDGFKEQPNGLLVPNSPSSKYASQQKVFDDLGTGVLQNAFDGFNCSLFAYGQTGSGKSYSMIGYGVNKGIVPITCEKLFERIGKSQDKFEVTFAMLEIYNEQVNDLLSKENQKGGLQVRQHPSQGYFYAQDLKKVPVGSYKEIERRIEEGTANRTVASTNMNATSSRAHTVVTITFDQIFNTSAGETKKSSVINLVDLAGSERADSTGATGDRLKEGANINKSLSALGNVISALADLSTGSKKKIVVPYRDSVLTKLLQNALGGNSKTIMIAALSPADINYVETLSTLRYADRAKRIKTKAVVNENPVDKLIRQLKEENDKLKSQLDSGKLTSVLESKVSAASSKEEMERIRREIFEELKAQMSINQKMILENKTSFKERLQKAQEESVADSRENNDKEIKKNKDPYLTNLNEDPILSYVICYFLDRSETKVGRSTDCQIQLNGLNIISEHAIITNQKGQISISPAQIGAKIKVNGANVEDSQVLEHKDRVLFGSSHMYVFINPQKQTANEPKITWEMAQKEMAEAKGFSLNEKTMSKEQQIIQEQIIELLPTVSDVNAISEELNKYKVFEVVLVPAIAFEDANTLQHKGSNNLTNQKVMVKMTNLQTLNVWLWDRSKLMNRKFLMQDHYQKFLEGEDYMLRLKKEDDPFWEPVEDLFVGLGNFFLQSLAYRMDFSDKCYITDYKGQEIGTLVVSIFPCDPSGNSLGEAAYLDEPSKLLSSPYSFNIVIESLEMGENSHAKGFKIKFKLFGDSAFSVTPVVANSPKMDFNFSRIVSFDSIKHDHLDFFQTGSITFIVLAIQKESSPKNNILGLSTRELKILRENEGRQNSKKSDKMSKDMDPVQIKLELSLLQKKYDLLDEKDKALQRLAASQAKVKQNSKDLQAFLIEVNRILNMKPKK